MKRVLVIGGGFAGAVAVRYLEKHSNFKVTLIDNKEYFEFTPGILRTIINPEHIKKIEIKHSDYLKRAEVIIGEVRILKKKEAVAYSNGKKRIIGFDYCVVASGSKYSSPIKEKNLVMTNRSKELSTYHKNIERANKILIIGGGLVGTELAGEIVSEYKGKKITVIESSGMLMNRQFPDVREYALEFMKKNGVEVIFNEKVIKSYNGKFITDKNRRISADAAFFCTGIKPNFEFMRNEFSKVITEKKIKVNEYLQIAGEKNIFSAGDIVQIEQEALAQNAEIMGKIVAKNILRMSKGREMIKYKPRNRIMVISLGRWKGIIAYREFRIFGIISAILKMLIEKWFMWKLRR